LKHVARLRFFHFNGATFIQPAREHLSKAFWHVLHNYDGSAKITRQLRQHILQSIGTAGRDSNRDYLRWRCLRLYPFLMDSGWLQRNDSFYARLSFCSDLDFPNQLGGDLFHLRRSRVPGLCDKIECP